MKTKRIKQLVFALLAVAMQLPVKSLAATASLSIEDFTISGGETKEMFIDLSNPDDDITLVQFDLRLPEGLTIAVEDGELAYDIAGRTTWKKHSLNTNTTSDGAIRFLLASSTNAVLNGSSGAIINIKLTAANNFNGGNITLEKILLVTPSAKETKPSNYIYTIAGESTGTAYLSIENFAISGGETKEMLIDLSNPDDEITLVQFDLRLPEGLTIAVEDGELAYDIAGRTTWKKHSLNTNTTSDGTIRFLLASSINALLNGTSGAIISIKLSASNIFNGGDITLEKILLVTPTAKETKPDDYIYTIVGQDKNLVTPPANLQTETYFVSAKYNNWDGEMSKWVLYDITGDVQIGFDGNDVYMQGLCVFFDDAWVKGTRSGNNLVFPSGQFLGTEDGYDCYFVGFKKKTNSIVDVVLKYNTETGEYTLPDDLWILDSTDKSTVCYGYYYDLLLSKTFMTVGVEEAGTLSSSITDDVKYQIESLKVYGQLNSTDFRLLRDMAGSDYMNNETQGKLKKLDMENAEVVAGGNDYLEWGYAGTWHIENNNELGNSVFYGCKKLEEVVLPEGLMSIKSNAFKGCENLKNVAFNDKLTSLGDGAFSETKLVNVELPDNVTTMGAAVFYGCKSLVSTTIPENLQTPLSQTFFDCSKLESVYSHLLDPAGLFGRTSYTAFDYYDANYNLLFTNATLYVPAGTKAKYQADEGWNKFKNIVEMEGVESGDVNGDNVVDEADIASVISVMASNGTHGSVPHNVDVNGDGKADVADIITIISKMTARARIQHETKR